LCSPLLRFNCAQSLTYILFHYDAIVSLQQLPLTNEGIPDSLLTPPEPPHDHRHHPAAHDRLAYPLYGLTEEEIAIVEGAA